MSALMLSLPSDGGQFPASLVAPLEGRSRPCIEHGWFWVPAELLRGDRDLSRIARALTVRPKFAEDGEAPIRLIRVNAEHGYVGLPRAFAKRLFPEQAGNTVDLTTAGMPMISPELYRRPNPNHPSVKDPARQADFIQRLHRALPEHRHFLASAPTGSGKTVCALDMALGAGRKTLILVHLERLMSQWIEQSLMGILGVPRERIGRIQGPICEWEDRDFVVGMLHSLSQRAYPREVYDAFGLVIFDETHKLGARTFSEVAPLFSAGYRVGLSATMERKDGSSSIFFWHLGPIRVRSRATALPMRVQVRRYAAAPGSVWSGAHGAVVKSLTLDSRRNMMLASIVKEFWDRSRQALIVGESIRHLQVLQELAEGLGVPREAMGQFTASRLVPDYRTGKQRKTPSAELDRVKAESPLVFATYSMITEGVDIPRLDAGLDATPRASAIQLVGRIRRPVPGKKTPVWVTIEDTSSSVLIGYFKARLREYEKSGNVEVCYVG